MSAAQSAPNTTELAVQDLLQDYLAVRQRSLDLVAPLSAEDCAIQSMADASPSKWHLAHSSWFFETFLLQAHQPGYTVFDPAFAYLFNSYYEAVGPRHARPQRGLLSRPSLQRVLEYRQAVDAAVVQGLQSGALQAQAPLLRLGLAHEQQHQELLLTDIKHALAQNPLQEAYDARSGQPEPVMEGEGLPAAGWLSRPEGFAELGHGAEAGFAFDNESPRHRVWLPAY
ncbi:MAG: DinB family protein, partial [Oceanococcaceae bacterium]